MKINYYLQRIKRIVKNKWWLMLICTAFSCIVSFGIADIKIEQNAINEMQYNEKVNDYEKKLQMYDDAIEDMTSSIAANQIMIDELQEYIDKSVYMNLDSNNIYVSNNQYAFMENEYAQIQNALVTYIKEGGLVSDIMENYEDSLNPYLSEIISCSVNGSILNVSVMHYDPDAAEELINLVDWNVLSKCDELSKIYGTFKIEKIDSSLYTKADSNVLGYQNAKLSDMRSYTNTISELEKKRVDQMTSKNNFIDGYKPFFSGESSKKILMMHMFFGVLAGVSIALSSFLLVVIIDDRIVEAKEIHTLKLNVLGEVQYKKILNESLKITLDEFVEELKSLKNVNNLYFSVLCSDILKKEIFTRKSEENNKIELKKNIGFEVMDSVEDLKYMLNAGICVLLIELGTTTYSQIYEHIELCYKLNVEILGGILIQKDKE